MKTVLLGSGLLLILSVAGVAQSNMSASSSATATAKTQVKKTNIASGTQLAAQLQNTLDAKNANVGDQVVLKTTNAVKQNGQVTVKKGARLIGHVAEVQKKAKGNLGSRVRVVFDTLEQGGSQIPINAVITSVVQASSRLTAGDDVQGSGSGMMTTQAQTQPANGGSGLLGGVTNTAGNLINTTTQTTGSVLNTTSQTLGSTTSTVGGTLHGLQISQSSDTAASGGSTLSLGNGNLRLEKGATFNLNLSQTTSVKPN